MNIKYLDVVENFGIYLQNNSNLSLRSIYAYKKVIKSMINFYGVDPSVEKLNQFLLRSPSLSKFALKYFLDFRWRTKVFNRLTFPKYDNIVKKKTPITKEQAKMIIQCIEDPKHKLMAQIQYFTGAKAYEVIPIKKEHIIKEFEEKRIRIDIENSNGKKDSLYLIDSIWYDIQNCMLKDGQYLFLNNAEGLNEDQMLKKIESAYIQYYNSLKNASLDVGINISTHDWRVGFARVVEEESNDKFEVQRLMRNTNLSFTIKNYFHGKEKTAKGMLKYQKAIEQG